MPTICLDAGHGGSDSGATYGSRYEKTDTLALVLEIKKLLEEQGVKVILTRSSDVSVSLSRRCEIANNNNADYFLSIHRNSYNSTVSGNEIWIYSKANADTTNKATSILNAVNNVVSVPNRGVKKGITGDPNSDLAINRESKMASALLELLFISNPNDNALYDKYLYKYAVAIAKALCSIVGITYKDLNIPATDSGKLYRVQVGAYSQKSNAEKMKQELQSKGYDAIIV